jgi:hypothetical protein
MCSLMVLIVGLLLALCATAKVALKVNNNKRIASLNIRASETSLVI